MKLYTYTQIYMGHTKVTLKLFDDFDVAAQSTISVISIVKFIILNKCDHLCLNKRKHIILHAV